MTSAAHRPAARPPRLTAWLAARTVRHLAWRETALGDLAEEFDEAAVRVGQRRARWWYRRQVTQLAAERAADALTSARDALRTLIVPSGDRPMSALSHDVRLALRSLRRRPLMTAIIVGTLALGLGANAATFGMIDRLLLRPFTFDRVDVDRLVVLSEESAADPFQSPSASSASFMAWRAQTTTVDPLVAFAWWDINLSGGHQPERVQGHRVTHGFFAMLGVTAAHGRVLVEDDPVEGRHQRIVMGHGLWQRNFGGDPGVVGRTIKVDGEAYEVVGIAEPGFDFPNATELWAPLPLSEADAENLRSQYLTVAGALGSGATLSDARAELTSIYARLLTDHAEEMRGRRLGVNTFSAGLVDRGMPQILMLWQAAALLVLLIGGVNVANLLLARGAERRRELAVRLAIGAGRAHLIRQLLVESVVLALIAVPAALAVAWASLRLLRSAMPASLTRFLPGWAEMGLSLEMVAFTSVAALGVALLFGLLPALRSSRPALAVTLRDGGRGTTGGSRGNRLRRGLVVAQLALALPLLVVAGLSVVGVQRFATGPQGFNPEGVIKARTSLPAAAYPDADSRRLFHERLMQSAAGIPGALAVATSSSVPSTTYGSSRTVVIDGVEPGGGMAPTTEFRSVSPGYLALMEIPLRSGRHLTPSDRADTEPVVIISESFARRFWPDESALDQLVAFSTTEGAPRHRVVGVVGDTIDNWFLGSAVSTAYVPAAQSPTSSMYLVARTTAAPSTLAESLRTAIAAADPDQAAYDVATMRATIYERTIGLRFIAGLMIAFGSIALVLAAFGIYGVMAHQVEQRRHEIGVRMALGASSGRVLRDTLTHGARLSAIGLAVGLAVGIPLASFMENALFGIVAVEPALFAGITVALALVAGAATLVPATTATRVDPMTALRAE